jgi:PDZ domain-containing protein
MRFKAAFSVGVFIAVVLAQNLLAVPPESKWVTVPFKLSHNRVVIEVAVRLSDGTTQRVHAWVDNGNPDLSMSQRLATGGVTCDGQLCSAAAPVEMNVGGMTIPLGGRIAGAGIKEARVSPIESAPIAPGLNADINIPSTVLSHYDVLVDFPAQQFTIGQPGSLEFNGVKSKAVVDPQNGLVQIPSQLERKKYNLGLDMGSSISYLSEELFDQLSASHPEWPHMTGAVGPANVSGEDNEIDEKLMRVDRVQYGPLFLTNVAVARRPRSAPGAGIPSAGSLGSEALLNYRVGIDYAHSTVYFDIGRLFNFPDFDVVGLILRPEHDGRFTVLGIAEFEGKPSVPQGNDGVQAGDRLLAVDGIPVQGSTLGQVWSMLSGSPGQERTLALERGGKEFVVAAQVQHFLGDTLQEDQTKKQSGKKKN